MLCTCPSRKNALNYQQIPTTGCNYSLNRLRTLLNAADPSAPIYCYVMTSVRNRDSILQHKGSGPNWQGGTITLCTCKHFMRTFSDIKQGTWITGFSGVSAFEGKNYLIYLMRVAQTFESHYDLWYHLPEEVREAKAADIHPLGDIFRPLGRDTQQSPFNPAKYHEPCQGHSHGRNQHWHKDINYHMKNGKHHLLCVGDKDYSFVWDKCMVTIDHNIGRGQKKLELKEYKSHLQDSECERCC